MSENIEEPRTNEENAAPAKPKRAPRTRKTTKAVAPAVDEAQGLNAPAAQNVQDSGAEESAPAKPKRTRKKAGTAAVEVAEEAPAKPKRATRSRKKAEDAAHPVEEVTSAVAESLAQLEPKARKPRAKKNAELSLDELADAVEPAKRKSAKAKASDADAVVDAPAPVRKRVTRKKAEPVAAQEKTRESMEAAATQDEAPALGMTALLFQEPDVTRLRTRKRKSEATEEDSVEKDETTPEKNRSRRSSKKAAVEAAEEPTQAESNEVEDEVAEDESSTRRRRRGSRGRRKSAEGAEVQEESGDNASSEAQDEAEEEVTTKRRRRRSREARNESANDEVTAPKGSTRLEAKRQRRKEGREAGRRRHTISESEYLARRESVKREMLVREQDGLNQIAVLEDDVLVEHYVARHTQVSMVGNVYLGRVQNVLPSMEAAFVDIGKGRNAVLYAGEVNWEAVGMEGKPRRIEQALKSGDTVLVQVTKDPIGHKGARLTAQITLAGRHLVLVPSGAMTGISRKLPEKERQRLKKLLREIVPAEHGVIVRTAAEGTTEEQLRADVERLTAAWADIQSKAKNTKSAPTLLKGEPELAVRVVRDIFNEDFQSLKVQGGNAWQTIYEYVAELSPELSQRLEHWTDPTDIFTKHRVDEQLAKAFDRKVWLPSGGTLVIDRTEAMTVIDVNTGKFTGVGGTLEETVTRNNLEAAEEIVRQLRLRDIGGIIVVDFIDMVLEANRELVLRRLVECLGRDRTRHQVAEVTSLGLVQMTRKRVGQGLVEAFSTTCEACEGRGYISHTHPVERGEVQDHSTSRRTKKQKDVAPAAPEPVAEEDPKHDEIKATINSIAAAAATKHDGESASHAEESGEETPKKRGSRSRKKSGEKGEKSALARALAPAPASSDSGSDSGSDAPKATRKRRVVSSGTITPGSGSGPVILSFPAQ